MKKRFIAMMVVLVVGSGGWIFGWNYLSAKADGAFADRIAKINDGKRQFSCDDRRTGGFPFRLAIRCDNPSFEEQGGVKISAAGLHAQAFVYRPLHQVIDFKSPAELSLGQLGRLQLTWKTARLGSELSTSGVSAATAKIEGAVLTPLDVARRFQGTSLQADKVMISMRRSEGEEPENALVAGVHATAVSATGQAFALPSVDVGALILAHDMAPVFDGKVRKPLRFWVENGGEADVQLLRVQSGESRLQAKGWVKLDNQGFIHAELDVDSVALAGFVEKLGPDLQQFKAAGSAIAAAIEQLGETGELDGKPSRRVKVSVRKGFMQVGFIPLLNIPPIDVSKL